MDSAQAAIKLIVTCRAAPRRVRVNLCGCRTPRRAAFTATLRALQAHLLRLPHHGWLASVATWPAPDFYGDRP